MSATPDELIAEAARWLRFAAEDLETTASDAADALVAARDVLARMVSDLSARGAASAL